jgi:conjugal transfer pilus assembly protein TraU
MTLYRSLLLFAVALGFSATVQAASCKGKFPNPITDICWSCVLPIKIGSAQLLSMDQEDNDSSPNGVLCVCTEGGLPRVGINMSFFEPARIAESVRVPYCFPSLGGMKIDFGIHAPEHGTMNKGEASQMQTAFYQEHWYMNPLMFWLEVLLDNFCLERGSFDLAYLTEVDPLWGDDLASFILSPDVVLFANLAAQSVCIADCIAATAGFPRNELFWCAGCQGGMYPLTGWVPAKYGMVQASALLTQRITDKLHRQGVMWAASGEDGQCGYYPQLLMDKTNYKTQMLYPIPQTQKWQGKCCQPFGRSTMLVESGKEYPYDGEDATWQIFRKRDCCAGNFLY